MHEYFGWIPTITGRLSFSTIGTGKNPEKEFKFFKAVGATRLTVVAQKRRNTDAVFGKFGDLLNWFRKREGYSVLVFFGSTSARTDYNILSGPCLELSLTAFEELKPKLERLHQLESSNQIEEHFVETAHAFLQESALRPGAFSAVRIFRNGKAEISFSEDSRISEKVEKILASQVFFFLRDIAHIHQHHAPTTDTILDVTSAKLGESAWKRETLYSLYRWVIHRKRERSLQSLLNCRGVLAYAQAFEKTVCEPGVGLSPQFYKSGRPKNPQSSQTSSVKYNHETTLESVNSSIETLKEEELGRIDVFSFVSEKVLPLFAAFIAILTPIYDGALAEGASRQQMLVATAAKWANENILLSVFGLLTISFVLSLTSILKRKFFQVDVFRDLLRVLLSISSRKSDLVSLAVFLIVILTALLLNVLGVLNEQAVNEWIGHGKV